MITRHRLSFLALTVLVCLLPDQAHAQSLIIAEPTGKSAWVGDSNVTFDVVTTGSATFQWQVKPSGGSSYTSLTNSSFASGVTTSTLTLLSANLSLDGNKYRCQVTSNGVTTSSLGAQLKMFSAPSLSPTVTVTPSSIAANSTANISIKITGLNTGDTVRIRRFLDINGNGTADTGEPLIQSFPVTDGQNTTFGGVIDPQIPGDDDGAANGTITTHFTLPLSPEVGRTAGSYIIRVSSPTGEFRSINKTLTITQPTYAQKVSGIITSNGSPVPFASAILLSVGSDNNFTYITSVVSNSSGSYSINSPVGSYVILPFKLGYSAPLNSAVQVTVAANVNQTVTGPSLNAATDTITGQVFDANNSTITLQGVQLFVQSNNNGEIVITTSNSDGVFDAPVTSATDWDFQVSSFSSNLLGYLVPQSDSVFASGSQQVAINLTQANALIYGSFQNNLGTPLPNVDVNANDNNFNEDALTDLLGNYFLLAVGPNSGNPDTWYVSPSNDNNPGLNGYVPPNGQSADVFSGNAYSLPFTTTLVTAHLTGTIVNKSNGNSPIPDAVIDATEQVGNSSLFIQATADDSGHFDLGVVGGSWTLTLDNDSASSAFVVGALLTENVTDGQTISGISFPVLSAEATINGRVTDLASQPVTFTEVGATATLNGQEYFAGAQTDGGGNYNFPVVNGQWDVFVTQTGFTDQMVNIMNGVGQMVNLTQIPGNVITSQPQNASIFEGQNTSFNISTSTPGSATFNWQVSTDTGASWSNLTNTGPYSSVNTRNLQINNATLDLNGNEYQCLVTYMLNGTPVTATSDSATLTVNAAPNSPAITQAPSNSTVTAGADTQFSAGAIGNPSPALQWQISVDGGNTWSNLTDNTTISGSQGGFLNISNATLAMSGQQFRLFISNINGNSASAGAVLTVNPSTTAPSFGLNPSNTSIVIGTGNTTFTANASGNPAPTLVWQFSADGVSGWANLTDNATISGAQNGNGTLTILSPPLSFSGEFFRLLAYNSVGTATSTAAQLTVNTPVFSITQQPANAYALSGKPASFSVVASITEGPGLLSYQWKFNGANITGATGSTYSIAKVATKNFGNYSVLVTESFGGAKLSNNATLALGVVPKVTTPPASVTVIAGGIANFTISGTSTPMPAIQWQYLATGSKTWANLTNAPANSTTPDSVFGANTSLLQIANVDGSVSGYQFRAYAVNSVGNTTSKAATLTVDSPASLIGVAASLSAINGTITLAAGSPVMLSVNATGTALKYQWLLNGVAIKGATKSTYAISKTAGTNSGNYTVTVTATVGQSVTSTPPIVLNVQTKPTFITQPKLPKSITTGGMVTFTALALANPPPTYQWQFNGANITGATNASLTLNAVTSGNNGAYLVEAINILGTTKSSSVKLSLKN